MQPPTSGKGIFTPAGPAPREQPSHLWSMAQHPLAWGKPGTLLQSEPVGQLQLMCTVTLQLMWTALLQPKCTVVMQLMCTEVVLLACTPPRQIKRNRPYS